LKLSMKRFAHRQQRCRSAPAGTRASSVALEGATRGDVGGLGSHRRDPCLDRLGHELRPVVGADVARHTAQDEEIGEDIDHVRGLELAGNPDRQALVRELVDEVEHAVLPSVMGAILDEVVGPDVVRALGSGPEAGSVRQPEPPALGLLLGDFQSLAPPDPLHPLVVDHPASGRAQQLRDLAVAVAAVLARKLDDVGRELFLVVPAPRALALRRAVRAERSADAALGYPKLSSDVLDADAAPRGAQ
jgi:hypothetical protein